MSNRYIAKDLISKKEKKKVAFSRSYSFGVLSMLQRIVFSETSTLISRLDGFQGLDSSKRLKSIFKNVRPLRNGFGFHCSTMQYFGTIKLQNWEKEPRIVTFLVFLFFQLLNGPSREMVVATDDYRILLNQLGWPSLSRK